MMADDPWAGFEAVSVGKPADAAPAPSAWSQFEEIGPNTKKAAPVAKAVARPDTAPESDGSFGESANALTGGAVRGVPIIGPMLDSSARKAAAGVRSMIYGTPYDEELKAVSDYADKAAKAHPALETTGEIAGGVGTLIPLGMTGIGARAMGITGGSLPSRMLAGGATNAVIGGADAAVRGRDPATGTGIGFGVGAALPGVGRVAGSLFESLANRAARPNFAGSATSKVERAIADDALTPQGIQTRLGELGPEGMLADVSPNLRSQAEAIAATPGPGQRVVLDAVHGRTQGAPGRITADLDTAMGGPVNPTDEIASILQRRQQQAAPLYQQAYQQPVRMTQDVADALGTPAGQQAIRRAERLALNEGGALQANVRGLDLVQRALDDMATTAGRAGRNNEARILRDLHGRIVSEVETQVPVWRAARQLYRSESATAEALDAGRNIFSRAVTPDELAAQMRGMSHAERDAFTQGARSGIADIMGSARNDANAARALFEKGWTIDKLNSVIGPQATTQLLRALQREGTFFGTASGITGNSRTAARLAAGKEFPSGIGDPHVPTTLAEAAMYIPRKIANAVAGSTLRARAAQQGADAARALTATGADRDAIVQAILAAHARRAAVGGARGGVEGGVILGGDAAGQRMLSR